MNIAILSFQDNTDIIGAKYIHAYLGAHNHNSHLILQRDPNPASDAAILDFVADNGIGVVGISVMSGEFHRSCLFAARFRERFKNSIPLVYGGIHATIAPEECLAAGDIAVRGEGEVVFEELARCIEERRDFSGLPGICLNRGGVIKLNPPGPLETDLDKFPFPKHRPENMYVVHRARVLRLDQGLFQSFSRYSGAFPNIITTRGCPYACAYCCNSALKDLYPRYPVRRRSAGSVIAEILEITRENPGCFSLNIQDDCFLVYPAGWIADFSRQYREKIRLPFVLRTTPRHINEEKLALLREAGLIIVMMGLQSGSDRINREIYKRDISSDTFLKAARVVQAAGLSAYYDVILDNPYETGDDLADTLKVLLQIKKPFQLQLFSLCLYQGTELNRRAAAENLAFMDPKKDDNERIDPTPLNKLICLTPTVPAPVVEFLMARRNKPGISAVIGVAALLNNAVLKPVSMLRLMHRAYGSKWRTTLRLMRVFGRTAIRKFLLS